MKEGIRLLTQESCHTLLSFTTDGSLRSQYNSDSFDLTNFSFLRLKTKYSIDPELKLGISAKDDCENSKAIFLQLPLDKVQANDKRLWTTLTHTLFFTYARRRWNIDASTSDETIISRFHFEGSGLEARMRNAISRLWWAAKITFDEKRDNNFELTELLWEKQDIITSLVERSLGSYPNVLHAFLEVYQSNKHLRESEIRALARGLNAIGGVKLLPLLEKSEVKEELRRICDFHKLEISL